MPPARAEVCFTQDGGDPRPLTLIFFFGLRFFRSVRFSADMEAQVAGTGTLFMGAASKIALLIYA
jgi:hypothetical protein